MSPTGFDQGPTAPGASRSSPIHRKTSTVPGAFYDEHKSLPAHETSQQPQLSYPMDTQSPRESGTRPTPRPRKHWPPRTCRICLETINPTFHPPAENVPGFLQASPSVTYDSPDPEAGRLLRPCKCKGSSRYVHEGCLQAWRHADPRYGKRNYWQCPTCGFRYLLERMRWGRWISSTATQTFLTIFIFFMTLFVLGFVADPIINLYADPFSLFSSAPMSKIGTKIEPIFPENDVSLWMEHFVKGLASLGLLGFVKVVFALSPWQWWNLRSTGIIRGSGHSGNTGRDRLANISWIVLVIGIGTFLWAVYKGVRSWSRRTLEKAGERVMDVPGDDSEEEE